MDNGNKQSKWAQRIEEEKLKQAAAYYRHPMTLGEIAEAEGGTELTYQVNPVTIKIACMEFALEISKGQCSIPTSDNVLECAKTLFAWITQDDD